MLAGLNKVTHLPVTFLRDEVSSRQRRDGQSVEVHPTREIRTLPAGQAVLPSRTSEFQVNMSFGRAGSLEPTD
jgi:hypothetical protein